MLRRREAFVIYGVAFFDIGQLERVFGISFRLVALFGALHIDGGEARKF
jgi:hypothetical protein